MNMSLSNCSISSLILHQVQLVKHRYQMIQHHFLSENFQKHQSQSLTSEQIPDDDAVIQARSKARREAL